MGWVGWGRRRPQANFKPHWEVTCYTRWWMRLITLFPCLRNFFDQEFCKNLCWWCGWWWDWLLCSHALEILFMKNFAKPMLMIWLQKSPSKCCNTHFEGLKPWPNMLQSCSNNTGNLGLVPGLLDYGARFFIFSYYPHSPTIGNKFNHWQGYVLLIGAILVLYVPNGCSLR